MQFHILSQASITPIQRNLQTCRYSGAVYDAEGHLLINSLRGQKALWKSVDPDHCPDLTFETLETPSVYLGHIFDQHGHYLMETLTQLALLQYLNPSLAQCLYFHPFHDSISENRLADTQQLATNLLGFTPEIRLCDRPYRCEVLAVAERVLHINHGISTDDARLVRKAISNMLGLSAHTPPFRRLFIMPSSRLNRRVDDPLYCDTAQRFADWGFELFDPCALSLFTQAKYFAETACLAGFSGSGLHNVLFMSPETDLICLGDSRDPHALSVNQAICNGMSAVRCHFVPRAQVQSLHQDWVISHTRCGI
ncbi:MAG: glycosyltransferase 61 family protein [Methylococcaceae bacterium]